MKLGNLKIALLAGSVGLVATLVACSSEEVAVDPDGSSSGGGSTDGGSSGTNTSGGSSGASSSSGGLEAKGGFISLSQTITEIPNADPVISASASASFFRGTGGGLGGAATCTTTEAGACKVVVCDTSGPTPDAGTTDAGPVTAPSAGDIVINGGTPLTLTPQADGTYEYKTLTTRLWDATDISVKAAGADVPAFEQALPPPGSITLTAPVFPAPPAKLTVSRTGDLALSWTGGTAGKVTFLTSTTDPNAATKSAVLTCSFEATAGSGTVPAAALGKLYAADSALSVGVSSGKEVDVDGWKVTLSASGPGTSGLATFE